jgi:hypothetical protein
LSAINHDFKPAHPQEPAQTTRIPGTPYADVVQLHCVVRIYGTSLKQSLQLPTTERSFDGDPVGDANHGVAGWREVDIAKQVGRQSRIHLAHDTSLCRYVPR